MSLSGGTSVSHAIFLGVQRSLCCSDISVPDAYLPPIGPALAPVTPATQAYLTILSKPSIPETPKAPSKPRRTSSSPKAPRIPKSPSKKGSLKDALFGPRVVSSSGPKTRGAISCLACRDRKKPVSIRMYFTFVFKLTSIVF